ncbi:neutral zinc metallopeptidase [Propioniciclava soli]|uniref:Neutral zinc metallopeptidase n=1 Tax=Propioniciclava soli TaxID=2775081 RepID=A0ABZ3C922_9ACTN
MSQYPSGPSGRQPSWQTPQYAPSGSGRPAAPWPQAAWPAQAPWPSQRPVPRQVQRVPFGAPPGWPAPPRRPPRRRRRGGLGSLLTLVLLFWGFTTVSSGLRDFVQPAQPSSPGSSGSASTPSGGVGGYENESYSPPAADLNPPPVPGPRNLNAAESLVTANPVYDQSVPTPTNCPMTDLDMRTAGRAAMEDHLNDQMGCLMRVFAAPVEAADFTMPRPPVTVYDRPIRTACGDFGEVNAAYCTGDQRIYYAQPLLQSFPAEVSGTPYAAEMIIAHEFGHAVQARTAVLVSEKMLEQQARSESAALELSRRTEVQADCLAGLYVSSVAQSQQMGSAELAGLGALAHNLGDDVLSGQPNIDGGHGTGAARQDWFNRGLGSADLAVCNSFVADATEVR